MKIIRLNFLLFITFGNIDNDDDDENSDCEDDDSGHDFHRGVNTIIKIQFRLVITKTKV